MTSVTLHWAAAYVGKPWRSAACGPHAYYCWGLVQRLCQIRLAARMPDLVLGDDNQAAIMEAVRGLGWSRVDGAPRENDIILARRRDGARHCGYMVHDGRRLGVLHADGHLSASGPIGAVVFQTIAEFTSGGYSDHEFWRHA